MSVKCSPLKISVLVLLPLACLFVTLSDRNLQDGQAAPVEKSHEESEALTKTDARDQEVFSDVDLKQAWGQRDAANLAASQRIALYGFIVTGLLVLLMTLFVLSRRKRFFRSPPKTLLKSTSTQEVPALPPIRRYIIVPAMVLAGLLLMTFFAWNFAKRAIEQHGQSVFLADIHRIKNKISDHIQAYIDATYGARGLFAASKSVERNEWAAYAREINLTQRYPGIRAMRFIQRISSDQREEFVKSVRMDTSLFPSGHPNFMIRPYGERDEYYVVKYAEPLADRERMLGFDIASDPTCRGWFDYARDKNRFVMTRRMDFYSGDKPEQGLGILLPIYVNEATIESEAERRDHLVGFVDVIFKPEEFFSKIAGEMPYAKGVSLEVYTSEFYSKSQTTLDHRYERIYKSPDTAPLTNQTVPPSFTSKLDMDVGDRTWVLLFHSTAYYPLDLIYKILPWAVLFGGLMISFLISGILYVFSNTSSRAVSIAMEMTKDLRESRERVSDLMTQAPDPIVILDLLGFVKEINPAAEKISGYSANEFVGRHFAQTGILSLPSLKKAMEEFLFLAAGMERPPYELEMLKKDGSLLVVEAHSRIIKQSHTKLVQVIMRDITERKRIDKEIRQLSVAVEQSPSSIVITDLEGNIQYVNKKFEETTGYSAAEAIGKNPRILKSGYTCAEEYKKLWDTITSGREWHGEFHNKRKDGSLYWESAAIVPIRNAEDKMVSYLAIKNDITERKKATEKLRLQSAMIDHLSEAVVVVHTNQNIFYTNPKFDQMFGYEPGELIGKPISICHAPTGMKPEELTKIIADQLTATGKWSGETLNIRKDGTKFWCQVSIATFLSEEYGRLWLSVREDITERKKLEAQLIQSQKMETVGTLAGGIAHDLNNQLTPVKGYLDLLLNQTDPNGSIHRLLLEASQSADRCAEVIQRLMNFSRPATHKKENLSMATILHELKILLDKLLPATIRLTLDCPRDIWLVEGDETEFHTLFMNLAVNARDAMPQGGDLKITVENINFEETKPGLKHQPGPYVHISMRDTGVGMTQEVMSRIFEPFFTTKKKGQGTGLGLAMVFKTVRDHRGWVDVSSQPGHGTVFQIYLPAKPGVKETKEEVSTGLLSDLLAKGETILFADDEEVIRNLGKVFLERLGYKVLLASDGGEAVHLYEQNFKTIAALILDMTMPKLTGRQMLARILAINPEARVIIASGYTTEGGSKDLMAMGAKDFLQKPYTIFPLAKALKSVLASTTEYSI